MTSPFGDRPFIVGGIEWDGGYPVDNGPAPVPPYFPDEPMMPEQPMAQGPGFAKLLQDALAQNFPQFDMPKGGAEDGGMGSIRGGQNVGFSPIHMFPQEGYNFEPLDFLPRAQEVGFNPLALLRNARGFQ